MEEKQLKIYKTVYVSPDIHQRLKLYIVQNGFKGANDLIKYWLDALEELEKQNTSSSSYESDQNTNNINPTGTENQ